jgi:hypothetical protein
MLSIFTIRQKFVTIADMKLSQALSQLLNRQKTTIQGMVQTHTHTLVVGAGLFLTFLLLWSLVHFTSPNLAGNDGYFHIKFAQVIREQGIRPDYPWLPLTILNPAEYFDHHFLYHILLVPFSFGDLLWGGKWSATIFASLAFLMGWILLRGQGVPYASLWALAFFAVSEAFLFRLSMIRVQALSLFMLLLVLHLALKKKHRWLLPVAFIYTWLYDAFPIMLAMLLIYTLVVWAFERRLYVAPLLYAVSGVLLGLLINPYIPNNLIFIYRHYLPKIVDITGDTIYVGQEWYPYQTWSLVKNSGPALFAFGMGALALGLNNRRMESSTAVLFFMAIFFGALLLKSRRFIEYFPAFSLLFCAAAWKPLFREWSAQSRIPALVLAVLVIPAGVYNIQQTQLNIFNGNPATEFQAVSEWLIQNSPPESRVFQTDWDDFSRIFFHNTHNTYTIGLDPTYMYLYDPELYLTWRDTTQGWGNIGRVIKEEFGASYAITDREHYGFLDKTEQDPYLKLVYEDEYVVLFQLLDTPDPNKKSWYDN